MKTDLRELLTEGRVVEIEYKDSRVKMGIVKVDNSISHKTGSQAISSYDKNLEDENLECKITKIYEQTEDGLKLIWNRETNFIDWSDVRVDTPIMVKDATGMIWLKRHFAKFEDGRVYAWYNGMTSFTANCDECSGWEEVKLYN